MPIYIGNIDCQKIKLENYLLKIKKKLGLNPLLLTTVLKRPGYQKSISG